MVNDIKLIEHLPCYNCHSTSSHKLAGNQHESEIKMGENSVSIIAIHDGTGGIKSLNFNGPRSFSLSLDTHYFPGFIPNERLHNDDYDLGAKVVNQVCNACEAGWKGWVYLEEKKRDGITLVRKLEIWPYDARRPAPNGTPKTQDTPLYHIEQFPHQLVRITSRQDKCLFEYRRQSAKYRLEASSARSLLESIDAEMVPTAAILETLERRIQDERPKEYEDMLARTVAELDHQKAMATLSESAFETALILLHRADEQQALELARVSGISRKDFLNSVSMHSWFFMDEQQLANDLWLNRLAGLLNGPNYFLSRLKESEKEK